MYFRRLSLFAILSLATVAAAIFIGRGPVRARQDSHDFGTIYASSRAWLGGKNPYDHAVLADMWVRAGGPPERVPSEPRRRCVTIQVTRPAIAA